eukprot:3866858-Pleurochrysis_carterae.AAC.1
MSARQPPHRPTRPEARLRRPTNWILPRPPPDRGSTRRWERDPSSRARRPGLATASPTAPHDPRRDTDHPWPA